MAMFRAITAEEESAMALFRVLTRLKYPGAQTLARKAIDMNTRMQLSLF